MNTNVNKKDFSWKWYLVLVIVSEIVTFIVTLKLSFDYKKDIRHEMHIAISYGIMILMICFINGLIVFISSLIEIIKYKKYMANGNNNFINIIVGILSSIMLSLGISNLNYNLHYWVEGYGKIVDTTTLFLLGTGTVLIFSVFKSKNK